MTYHKNRFHDYSLMVFNSNKLIAILPAHRKGKNLYAHFGLSYGGIIWQRDVRFSETQSCFATILKYLHLQKIEKLFLNPVPYVYNTYFSNEMEYLCFKAEGKVYRKEINAVLDLKHPLPFSKNRKRLVQKAQNLEVRVMEVDAFNDFWEKILTPNLAQKHSVNPTHSLQEISLLKKSFPQNIKQFNAYFNDELIAGVTVFINPTVIHAQYISTLKKFNNLHGLDAIFNHLIKGVFREYRYFSFGISTQNEGKEINYNLLKWKESFGARAVIHQFIELKTGNYMNFDC